VKNFIFFIENIGKPTLFDYQSTSFIYFTSYLLFQDKTAIKIPFIINIFLKNITPFSNINNLKYLISFPGLSNDYGYSLATIQTNL